VEKLFYFSISKQAFLLGVVGHEKKRKHFVHDSTNKELLLHAAVVLYEIDFNLALSNSKFKTNQVSLSY